MYYMEVIPGVVYVLFCSVFIIDIKCGDYFFSLHTIFLVQYLSIANPAAGV